MEAPVFKATTQQRPDSVEGIVEADETFFTRSFKGQRFIAEREARKRGGEGKANKKDDKVAVLIVRSRQGDVYDCR